ncbi:PREDICTED: uncharacterized protein LOC109207269 [Nicotiana attenuata]|uniref:uncharacterized protein LOC109207269 n=1 Tax=Nicotiana attenuata TaxID=49451 RepID=UPI0009051C18|nr:PREDICTED: uncharacterized protein LOC109207269 [Nicotiana attenuata]
MDKAINSKKRAPTPTITSTQPWRNAASTNVETSKKTKSEKLPAGYTGTLEEKLKVEKFFADARNNLMNPNKNGKKFELEKFYATAWNNFMNSDKNEETNQETIDKNGKKEE